MLIIGDTIKFRNCDFETMEKSKYIISKISDIDYKTKTVHLENNYYLNVFIPTRRINYYNEKWEKQKGSYFESIFMILDPKIKQSKIIFEYELNKELKL